MQRSRQTKLLAKIERVVFVLNDYDCLMKRKILNENCPNAHQMPLPIYVQVNQRECTWCPRAGEVLSIAKSPGCYDKEFCLIQCC